MNISKPVTAVALALAAMSAPMLAQADCSRTTTGSITPPAGNKFKFAMEAKGVQIYDCKHDSTGAAAWVFRSPVAALSRNHKAVAIHFAGPRWKSISDSDNSAIQGSLCQSVPSDTNTPPLSINHLLLSATVETTGKLFGNVTFVQRVNTTGGLKPTSGCASESDVGAEADVPYTATYRFYKAETETK